MDKHISPDNSIELRDTGVVPVRERDARRAHIKEVRGMKVRGLTLALQIMLMVVTVLGTAFQSRIEKVTREVIEPEEIIVSSVSYNVLEQAERGQMKGYNNIAFFGIDAEDMYVDMPRSDTIIIVSINEDTHDVKLVSVFRDTYLEIDQEKGRYHKCNTAYAAGGPSQAIKMLNRNLDLNITDYVTVGFSALIEAIDALGGIELTITRAEIPHLNDYQQRMAEAEGVSYTPIEEEGYQHVNGMQAVGYCRIRYTEGDDFKRTERQRTVLRKMFDKAKKSNPAQMAMVLDSLLGRFETSLSLPFMLDCVLNMSTYSIVDQTGFPGTDAVDARSVKGKGSCVIARDLTESVEELHTFLFGESEYRPSQTVMDINSTIMLNVYGKKVKQAKEVPQVYGYEIYEDDASEEDDT